MTYFHQRLRAEIAARGFTISGLASIAGLDYGNTHRALTGVQVPMSLATALRAIEALPAATVSEQQELLEHAAVDRVLGELGAFVLTRALLRADHATIAAMGEMLREHIRAERGDRVRFGSAPIDLRTVAPEELLAAVARERPARMWREVAARSLLTTVTIDLTNSRITVSGGA